MGPEFTRECTLITLQGGGEEGIGEDVVYDALDHIAFRDEGPVLDLTGPATLGELSELMDGAGPVSQLAARARLLPALPALGVRVGRAGPGAAPGAAARWATWSGRAPQPLTYVVSMRLTGEPETSERLTSLLERYPSTRFKLDPTNTWSDELIAELAATGAVDSLDLKGHYKGTPVDVVTDAGLYRKIAEAFPDAWLEDPDLDDPEAAAALEGAARPHHLGRADPLGGRHRGARPSRPRR